MHKHLRKDQKGMVSIIVTMIMMIIITLVVIGFARLIRREQGQSLDEQLSTQAFYAAESGVNQAIYALDRRLSTDKRHCLPNSETVAELGPDADKVNAAFPANSNQIGTGSGVTNSCLLIDMTPPSLEYDSIGMETSMTIPIDSTTPIANLEISWQASGDVNDFNNCPGTDILPQIGSYSASPTTCDAGMLRVDLARTPDDGTLDLQYLATNTFSAILQPRDGNANPTQRTFADSSNTSSGLVIPVSCRVGTTNPRACNLIINAGLGGTSYALRIRSIYKANALTITATDSSGNKIELSGAQALVDSTGKANDVLRRVQVRVNIANTPEAPDFAIQTRDSICKRFSLIPSQPPLVDNGDPACRISP